MKPQTTFYAQHAYEKEKGKKERVKTKKEKEEQVFKRKGEKIKF